MTRSLGGLGVLGQSIAGEAPTATPTVNLAVVFLAVGSGSWLVFLIATFAILLVSANIIPFARRSSAAGSLSDYVGITLGPRWRIITGWMLLIAYLTIGIGILASCGGYVISLLDVFGWKPHQALVVLVVGIIASALAVRNIRISTGAMLGIEIVSICLVLLLCLAVLVRQGLEVDLSQFTFKGLSVSGMSSALLIGILSFAGFETAAALGEEAKDPLRTITKTMLVTPLVTGAFFIFTAYALVLGFDQYQVPVAGSDAPVAELATRMSRPGLGVMISFGAAISLFGCTVASLVAASRMAMSLSRLGVLPSFLAKVRTSDSAPHNAVIASVVVVVLTSFLFSIRFKPMDVFDWFATFGTFGTIGAYLLTSISAPFFLRARGELRPRNVLFAVLAVLILIYVCIASVYPTPAAPFNVLPWLFLVTTGVCAGTSLFVLRRRRSETGVG